MPPSTVQDASIPAPALSFSLEEFLANVHATESYVNSREALINFGPNARFKRAFLHSQIAQSIRGLVDKQINFLAFAQGHIIDSDDHFLISTLSKCTSENGVLEKDRIFEILFSPPVGLPTTNASASSALSTMLFLVQPLPLLHPVQPAQPLNRLTHEQAVNLVRGLERVKIGSIPSEDMRCSYCWINYDDTTDPANNEPAKLPCGHIVGFDCLVESLKQLGPKCGLCRLNIVEVAAQAPQHN